MPSGLTQEPSYIGDRVFLIPLYLFYLLLFYYLLAEIVLMGKQQSTVLCLAQNLCGFVWLELFLSHVMLL